MAQTETAVPQDAVQTPISNQNAEQMDDSSLLDLYRETGDPELKWMLVMRYTGLVRRIATHASGIYSSFAQLDDIIQEGLLVLLNAVDKFEPQKKDAVRRPFSYFIPCAWAIGYLPSGTERPCAHSPYKVFLKLLISGQHTLLMSAGSPQPGAGQRSLRLTKNGTRPQEDRQGQGGRDGCASGAGWSSQDPGTCGGSGG